MENPVTPSRILESGRVAQFVSIILTLFLVEKDNGKGQFPPVINLRALNRFVQTGSFKMEILQVAKALIQPGDYMTTIQVHAVYRTLPVPPLLIPRDPLRVSMPAVWPFICTSSLYKDPQTGSDANTLIENPTLIRSLRIRLNDVDILRACFRLPRSQDFVGGWH